SFLLVAASDDAARTLEASFTPLMERWKGMLAGVVATPVVRAIRRAVPTRRGRVVSIELREPLTAAEASGEAAAERAKEEKQKWAAAILNASLRGEPAPPAEIAKLQGGWEPKVHETP